MSRIGQRVVPERPQRCVGKTGQGRGSCEGEGAIFKNLVAGGRTGVIELQVYFPELVASCEKQFALKLDRIISPLYRTRPVPAAKL